MANHPAKSNQALWFGLVLTLVVYVYICVGWLVVWLAVELCVSGGGTTSTRLTKMSERMASVVSDCFMVSIRNPRHHQHFRFAFNKACSSHNINIINTIHTASPPPYKTEAISRNFNADIGQSMGVFL